ncbi:MAG: alpha/beta fold hydrolase [Chloroflexota bacterium]
MSVQQQFKTIRDNITLAYWDIGEGDPLVLLHGFTGTARRDLGDLIDTYSSDYRIIAPDLRGYGASRPPNRSFPLTSTNVMLWILPRCWMHLIWGHILSLVSAMAQRYPYWLPHCALTLCAGLWPGGIGGYLS